jgi:hypothetical protein
MRTRVYAAIAAVGSVGLVLAILLVSGAVNFGDHASARSKASVGRFSDRTSSSCSKLGRPRDGDPLFGGTATTVTTAQAVAGFPVLVPDVPAARLANLSQAWIAGRDVALVFAQGKVTITMTRANYSDALREFRRFIREMHADAVIGRVQGQPTLVITPRTDGCGSNPAVVEFKHQGINVNIVSHTYSTDTLLAIADSLRPRPAGQGQ